MEGRLPPIQSSSRRKQTKTTPLQASDSRDRRETESLSSSTNGLKRFKTIANKVRNQYVWTKGLRRAEQHLKTYVIPSDGDGQVTETLTFNINAFKPETQSCEALTPKAKAILKKPSWLRTEEELQFLHRFTIQLKCFDRYPVYVRRELAQILYYDAFEKDRVVIRQGDVGFNFYFILSGSVFVEMQEEDRRTGKKVNMIVGELSAGAAFGELALLHDDRRRATIVCHENSEFLRVDKPDFDEVLKKNHEREWLKRMQHFKEHPLFKHWSSANLHCAVEGSQTVEYTPNTVILKDLSALSDKVYFIIQGMCKVVQKIYVWGKVCDVSCHLSDSFKLPPISIGKRPIINASQPPSESCGMKVVKKWWVLRSLYPGDYFGVGEGDEGVSVISDQKVELLVVNKMVFLKHERGRGLNKMQAEMSKSYPSREAALNSFIDIKKWSGYKRHLVKESAKKLLLRRSLNTSQCR